MKKLHTGNKYSLDVERDGENIRVVLTDADMEVACHKIKPAKLKKFLTAENATLFKGRLQFKNN